MRIFTERRDRLLAERRVQIDAWEQGNADIARDVRARFEANEV